MRLAGVQSSGYRTDLIFARFDGVITERDDYLVVATPNNPTFHWGNFLLFPSPPSPADAERWPESFRREFSHDPRVRHIAIGWDRSREPVAEAVTFAAAGFVTHASIVLTATTVHETAKYDRTVSVRELRTDAEWEAATQLQILLRDAPYSLEGYTPFKRAQMARYRRMAERGMGGWFGAFVGPRLVADLGLFVEDGIGRFQNVGTHPEFRRRGICGRLVTEVARRGFATLGATALVMVADEAYHAARIYESVGFRPVERQAGVSWAHGAHAAPAPT